MTRKDYVAISDALNSARTSRNFVPTAQEFNLGVLTAAQRIADVMARDNPRFDRERFLKACGVQS